MVVVVVVCWMNSRTSILFMMRFESDTTVELHTHTNEEGKNETEFDQNGGDGMGDMDRIVVILHLAMDGEFRFSDSKRVGCDRLWVKLWKELRRTGALYSRILFAICAFDLL